MADRCHITATPVGLATCFGLHPRSAGNSRSVVALSATVIALTLVAHVVVFDEVWSVYRHTGHGYAPLGRALLIFGGATLFVTFARADRQWRPKHVASPTGVAVM